MYKFTNGIVVFDEQTKDDYVKAGFKLVEGQMNIKEAIEETIEEETNENEKDNSVVERKSKSSNRISK